MKISKSHIFMKKAKFKIVFWRNIVFKSSYYKEHKIFPVRIMFLFFLCLLNDYSVKDIILSVAGNAKMS